MVECLFCEIVEGSRASYAVWEDEHTFGFLDSKPVFPGHTLIVTRRHVETLPELPDNLLVPLFTAARTVAAAMLPAMGAHGTFVAMNNVVSQSVPHLHVHVVPRRFKDGLRGFFWPRTNYEGPAHAEQVRDALKAALAALG
ncbi:MAG: HIT family protein [Actinomycetota bacterium]